MAAPTRVIIDLPDPVAVIMDRLAKERGVSRPALIRQALGVLQCMHDGAKAGYYTGQTKVREDLSVLLVAPL